MRQEDPVRTRILDAAEQAFLSRGYSRVTMDDIATALRMSKKTLYRHFPSKEELGRAALESVIARVAADLRAVVTDRTLDFDARLERLVRTLAARYGASARVLEDFQRDAPALWSRLLELRRESIQATFGGLLAGAIRDGIIRPDVEPRLVIRMVLTLMDQLLRPDVLAELELGAEEVLPQLLSVVLEGIRVRPRRR